MAIYLFYEKIGDKFILSKNPYTTFRTIARSKVVNRWKQRRSDTISFIFICFSGICNRAVLLGDIRLLSEQRAKYDQYQGRNKRGNQSAHSGLRHTQHRFWYGARTQSTTDNRSRRNNQLLSDAAQTFRSVAAQRRGHTSDRKYHFNSCSARLVSM